MAPPLELLNYEEVMKVYREERKSQSLTELRRDFYAAVRAFLEQLKREYEKEAAVDSYSTKTRQLGQQITKIREKILQIFDFRAEKILLMATRGASGGKVDHSRMTEEEKALLESALGQVKQFRAGLLDMGRPTKGTEFQRMAVPEPSGTKEREKEILTNEEAAGPSIEVTTSDAGLPTVQAKEKPLMVEARAPPEATYQAPKEASAQSTALGATPAASETVLLRILVDIPPFAGPNGTYRLGKEDIVTLPLSIGKTLVKRGKAVEIVPGNS